MHAAVRQMDRSNSPAARRGPFRGDDTGGGGRREDREPPRARATRGGRSAIRALPTLRTMANSQAERPQFAPLPPFLDLQQEKRYRITEADVAFTQRSGGVKVRLLHASSVRNGGWEAVRRRQLVAS